MRAFDPERLWDRTTARGPSYLALIQGVTAHDTHHGGQIQLLRRLAADA